MRHCYTQNTQSRTSLLSNGTVISPVIAILSHPSQVLAVYPSGSVNALVGESKVS